MSMFSQHPKSAFWSSKNTKTPNEVALNSHKKFWFDCNKCGHSFETRLKIITRFNSWCPYCSNQKLCEDNECKSCFEKSFASHEKSKYLHDKTINPRTLFKNTHKKFLFDCDKCMHSFETTLQNLNQRNNWCYYCSTHCVTLCKDEKCNQCFEKSFASVERSKYLHDKTINPRTLFKNTHKKFLFDCDKCMHSFETRLSNLNQQNTWCNFCAHKKLCENNECKACFEKSFASHEKSKYWDIEKNNGINPRDIFKDCGKKYWINCNKCYQSFEINITSCNSICCPFCINKTEQMLFDKLVLYYPLLKRQYKKDWCKKINYLPFDFVIEDLKIIIELDGEQHFRQISNWLSSEKTQENDLYKMKCANENGFSVIRILQKDVYHDKYDWLQELIKHIEMLKSENVINVYMCKSNEYDCFNSK